MLQKFRCKNCHWTLMIASVDEGTIEIKCTNKMCRLINHIECEGGFCTVATIGVAHNKAVDKLAVYAKM